MLGSKYAPGSEKEYSAKDLNANFKGILFTATAGTTTTSDLLVSDDSLIDGAKLIVIGATIGDKGTLQVIDKDNVLGYGANTVLGQYVTDWYMNPNDSNQLDSKSAYPAKIFGGLYLRMIYTSVGPSDVNIILNYKLHKILW
jgi:hypothetical protein